MRAGWMSAVALVSAAAGCVMNNSAPSWKPGPAQQAQAPGYAGPPGTTTPGFPAQQERSGSMVRVDVWPAAWSTQPATTTTPPPPVVTTTTPEPQPPVITPPPPPIVASPEPPPVVAATPAIRTEDRELAEHVNAFRAAHGLPAVPISPQLTLVARTHVEDLRSHDKRAESCNMHSWSTGSEQWSGCCYTADHAQARCMWSKPKEISSYPGNGFEVAAWGSGLDYDGVVKLWDGSEGHRTVILNLGKWNDPWGAMGCAYSDSYSVCWFGEETDPSK